MGWNQAGVLNSRQRRLGVLSVSRSREKPWSQSQMEIRGRKEGDRLHDVAKLKLLSALWLLLAMCRQFPVSRRRPATARGTFGSFHHLSAIRCRGPLGDQSGTAASRGFSDGAKSCGGTTRSCPVFGSRRGPRGRFLLFGFGSLRF